MKKGPFDFPWREAEDDLLMGPTNYDNLDSEMAFVLYNIGVMFTCLANREDRTGSESMKTACTYYQNAAWAFHTLPDRYVINIHYLTNVYTQFMTNFTKCHFLSQWFTGSQAAFFNFYTQCTKDYKSKRAWAWCKN